MKMFFKNEWALWICTAPVLLEIPFRAAGVSGVFVTQLQDFAQKKICGSLFRLPHILVCVLKTQGKR